METQRQDGAKLIREVSRHLPCQLTDDEVLHYGEELASVVEDIGTEESRQKDVKAQLKARLTELESKRSQLASKVRRREELRDVPVSLYLRDDRMVEVVREDTGEILETRKAHEEELQDDLRFDDDESEAEEGTETE